MRDDKSTAAQETQSQQSYLQQAHPEYIPLLPPLPATQLHLYYERFYINQTQRQLLWNLRDLMYINHSAATSMLPQLWKGVPEVRGSPRECRQSQSDFAHSNWPHVIATAPTQTQKVRSLLELLSTCSGLPGSGQTRLHLPALAGTSVNNQSHP